MELFFVNKWIKSSFLLLLAAFFSIGCTIDAQLKLGEFGTSETLVPELSLAPLENKTLLAGDQIQFEVSGGVPPYTFETSGNGIFVSEGVYQAGYNSNDSVDEDIITVRDSIGQVKSYTVPVKKFKTANVFNYAQGGEKVVSRKMTHASDGSLYVVGSVGSVYPRWMVLKSVDQGVTWQALDSQQSSILKSEALAISIAPTGDIFVVGYKSTSSDEGSSMWLVRKSSDQGLTWTTILQYAEDETKNNQATGVVAGSLGEVFVVGSTQLPDESTSWVMKKSTNSGSSWSTVVLASSSAPTGKPYAITQSAIDSNKIYVGGTLDGYYTVMSSNDRGLTWSMSDQVTSGSGVVNAIAEDPTGKLFTVGSIYYFSGVSSPSGSSGNHAVLRVSSDLGASWSFRTYRAQYQAEYLDLEVSPNFAVDGTIYIAGRESDNGGNWDRHFILEQSLDGGATWSTKEKSQYTSNFSSWASSLTMLPDSSLFVSAVGTLDYKSSSYEHGLMYIRKLSHAGSSLSTVSTYYPLADRESVGVSVVRTPTGDLYSLGTAQPGSSLQGGWVIRKSTDQGLTWTQVDYFQCGDFNCLAKEITSDADGRIYAIGTYQGNSTSEYFLMIRSSIDGGATWSHHTWQLSAGKPAYGSSITTLPDGSILAYGTAFDSAFQLKGVLRKSVNYGATWTTVSTAFSALKIYTDSDGVVWAAGSGSIKKSTNGGSSWVDVYTAASTTFSVISNLGSALYAPARKYASGVTTIEMHRSLDGGLTWEIVDSFSNGYLDPSSVLIKSAQEIFYSGIMMEGDIKVGYIRSSNDGGQTWQFIEKSLLPGSSYSEQAVSELEFCDNLSSRVCYIGVAGNEKSVLGWIFRSLEIN